jgi:hypothetical protein
MNRELHIEEAATTAKVVATGAGTATERISLDYASWYARIAAPGSRIPAARRALRSIVRLDTVAYPALSAGIERRIA